MEQFLKILTLLMPLVLAWVGYSLDAAKRQRTGGGEQGFFSHILRKQRYRGKSAGVIQVVEGGRCGHAGTDSNGRI